MDHKKKTPTYVHKPLTDFDPIGEKTPPKNKDKPSSKPQRDERGRLIKGNTVGKQSTTDRQVNPPIDGRRPERDSKGRLLKGHAVGTQTQFKEGTLARAYVLRSNATKKRKETILDRLDRYLDHGEELTDFDMQLILKVLPASVPIKEETFIKLTDQPLKTFEDITNASTKIGEMMNEGEISIEECETAQRAFGHIASLKDGLEIGPHVQSIKEHRLTIETLLAHEKEEKE